jgi:hypothetical protein
MDLSQVGSVPFSDIIWLPSSRDARQDRLRDLEKSMNDRLERFSVKNGS